MAASVLMTSCTDESKSIVGTWVGSGIELSADGKTISGDLLDYNWEMVYMFYSDGTGAFIESIGGERTMSEFTWVLNGNSLTISHNGESDVLPITLSSKELCITVDQEINGKTYKAKIYFYR